MRLFILLLILLNLYVVATAQEVRFPSRCDYLRVVAMNPPCSVRCDEPDHWTYNLPSSWYIPPLCSDFHINNNN